MDNGTCDDEHQDWKDLHTIMKVLVTPALEVLYEEPKVMHEDNPNPNPNPNPYPNPNLTLTLAP